MSSISSDSDLNSDYSSGDEDYGYDGEAGVTLGYAFEPEYTEEELAQREHQHDANQQGQAQQGEVPMDEGGHEDRTRIPVEQWCQCGRNCVIMPTNIECDCCQDINMIRAKMDEIDPVPECITEHPDFDAVCMNTAVLDSIMSRLHYAYIERLADNKPSNKCYRFTAYKQFIFWIHRFLGKKVRRVVPSCVVKQIRGKFPSENGEYVGFLVALDNVDGVNVD